MSKIFTYIIHSFVPQIFIEHDKRGLYNMQGSVQSENVGAFVQKQDFYFLLWLLSPPSWYLFYLLFNVAFLKQRRTTSASIDHCKCPTPHPVVIEAARARQEYWSGFPFHSPVDHVLSELFTMTRLSWVILHSMARRSIELDKAVILVITLVSFLRLSFSVCLPLEVWG